MGRSANNQLADSANSFWSWFLGSLSLIFLSAFIGLFDTTTVLWPVHEGVDRARFVFAFVCGLVACGMGVYLGGGLSRVQRVLLPLVMLIEATVGIFLIAGHVSMMIEGWIDFPAGKTHTGQAFLAIAHAYRTHGKGTHQAVQTMPSGTEFDVAPEDYRFMQTHRRPGDAGKDPDQIASGGYFCLKVTVESTDEALRVLHAGSHELKQGTVVVCPSGQGTVSGPGTPAAR